ncbi:hypothetical protein GCM10010306_033180 [Streptomyces umbrinus]|uniref:hypothetical protein n=1 Tax=Streptomyces umbrinus TaxID=67370 RepID=UPI001678F632|nr:hypothetical protein [Streptomyces umbrinus]GHB36778.1 hypothetical protein GCM10010306_033180 [Streptomyces umbrinus]
MVEYVGRRLVRSRAQQLPRGTADKRVCGQELDGDRADGTDGQEESAGPGGEEGDGSLQGGGRVR